MMLRRLGLSLFLLAAIQHSASADAYRYRIYLDGKPDSEYVVLSERAQQRRSRQAIPADEADINVSESYLQQLRDAGLEILTRSRWLNTAVVKLVDGSKIEDAVWAKLPFVKKAELLTMPAAAPAHAKERTEEESQQEAQIEDCTSPLREVNAYESLYLAGHRGKDMLVAVFDGGFTRLDKCEFMNDKLVFSHDMYSPATTEALFEADSHGIQCMSIMACPETEGVCGTAQEAQYCVFRTEKGNHESSIEEDMWVAAAEMADSLGVDVISSSLGYSTFDNGLLSHTHAEFAQNTTVISRGAKIAAQKGIFVCSSAGNAGLKEWKQLLFPADVEEILTVGAYNTQLEAADFTSWGFLTPYVKPNVAARGQKCYTIVPVDQGFAVKNSASGTSFSTPLIAGLCASLWSAVPELTPAELRQVVCESASDYQFPNVQTGYGLPDFAIALQKARELHPSAIEQITTEAAVSETTASARYYNMMGQPLSAPPAKGMYIDRGRVVTQ